MISTAPLLPFVESRQVDRFARAFIARIRRTAASLGGALASHGSPGFFQFERRGPVHTRVGPGISHVSDSFWPLTEW